MATVVKCDNRKCNAHYEVSSFLGGHTFTCNECGSKVTVRDLRAVRPVSEQPSQAKPRARHGNPAILGLLIAILFAVFFALGYSSERG